MPSRCVEELEEKHLHGVAQATLIRFGTTKLPFRILQQPTVILSRELVLTRPRPWNLVLLVRELTFNEFISRRPALLTCSFVSNNSLVLHHTLPAEPFSGSCTEHSRIERFETCRRKISTQHSLHSHWKGRWPASLTDDELKLAARTLSIPSAWPALRSQLPVDQQV